MPPRTGHQFCRANGKPGILLLGEKAGTRESVNTIFGEQGKVSFDAHPHLFAEKVSLNARPHPNLLHRKCFFPTTLIRLRHVDSLAPARSALTGFRFANSFRRFPNGSSLPLPRAKNGREKGQRRRFLALQGPACEFSAGYFKDAANVSPSPGGEGRDEGERLRHLVEALMASVSYIPATGAAHEPAIR